VIAQKNQITESR